MKIAVTIIQLLCCIFLIVVVLLQSGKSSGLSGVVGGESSNNMGFSAAAKSKTLDAKLARWTKWVALAFVVLTFVLDLI